MTHYQVTIKEMLAKIGRDDIDPRHIEGLMRVGHGTLDGLDRAEFRREVKLCAKCLDELSAEEAEETAKSYGL